MLSQTCGVVTEAGPRFCPRCGTARVSGMPFCPNCGLNLAELGGMRAGDAGRTSEPESAAAAAVEPTDATASSIPAEAAAGAYAAQRIPADDDMHRPAYGASPRTLSTQPAARSSPPVPVLIALLIGGLVVVLALNGSGLLRLPGGGTGLGGGAAATASPTPAGPTFAPTSEAPPVGLAILSPTDGAVVGSQQIVVIGSAPAGLRVVHDVPLRFDQSATSDGTGHWAMTVNLNNGENTLKFRLGDDKSTEKRVRVTYSAPGG
jgi:hypothetical protein